MVFIQVCLIFLYFEFFFEFHHLLKSISFLQSLHFQVFLIILCVILYYFLQLFILILFEILGKHFYWLSGHFFFFFLVCFHCSYKAVPPSLPLSFPPSFHLPSLCGPPLSASTLQIPFTVDSTHTEQTQVLGIEREENDRALWNSPEEGGIEVENVAGGRGRPQIVS